MYYFNSFSSACQASGPCFVVLSSFLVCLNLQTRISQRKDLKFCCRSSGHASKLLEIISKKGKRVQPLPFNGSPRFSKLCTQRLNCNPCRLCRFLGLVDRAVSGQIPSRIIQQGYSVTICSFTYLGLAQGLSAPYSKNWIDEQFSG